MDRSNQFSRKQIGTPYFPQDIIEEILSIVPVKSLLRFRCVSKSWCLLISSKRFIKTHLQYSTRNIKFTDQALISIYKKFSDCRKDYSVLSSLDQTFTDVDNYSIGGSIGVVSCSNGLCCLQVNEADFYLWNPCTRKFNKLPPVGKIPPYSPLDSFGFVFGFGFDEFNDDYKVLAVLWDNCLGDHVTKIYRLKTNSWKRVKNFKDPNLFDYSIGKFVAGKLHWGMMDEVSSIWSIVYFDLNNEVHGVVEQLTFMDVTPTPTPTPTPSVEVFKECLCVLSYCSRDFCCRDVWILKEYGVKESWYRAIRVPDDHGPHNFLLPSVYPWCITQDFEILCSDYSNDPVFTFYNLKTNSYRDPRMSNVNEIYKVDRVQSLVSPFADGEPEKQNQNIC